MIMSNIVYFILLRKVDVLGRLPVVLVVYFLPLDTAVYKFIILEVVIELPIGGAGQTFLGSLYGMCITSP